MRQTGSVLEHPFAFMGWLEYLSYYSLRIRTKQTMDTSRRYVFGVKTAFWPLITAKQLRAASKPDAALAKGVY